MSLEKRECFDFNQSLGCVYFTLYSIETLKESIHYEVNYKLSEENNNVTGWKLIMSHEVVYLICSSSFGSSMQYYERAGITNQQAEMINLT